MANIEVKYPSNRAKLGYIVDSDEIAAAIGSTLTELPEADASKAGQQFWLNGTLWTYAKDGQFGALAEGEPWPVKGYKEYIALLSQTGTNNPTAQVIINDGNWDIQYNRTGDQNGEYESNISTIVGLNAIRYLQTGAGGFGDDATVSQFEGQSDTFRTFVNNVPFDGVLTNTPLFIREYPPTS